MPINPYERYKQQSVMTMTPGEMLNKLYEEAIKQLSGAIIFIDEKDVVQSNRALQKAQNIIRHLKATLNFEYEISNNLDALYNFFIERIVAANVRKDSDGLPEVITMLGELRETFAQADKLARTR